MSEEAKILALKTLVPNELTGNVFVGKGHTSFKQLFDQISLFVKERTFKDVVTPKNQKADADGVREMLDMGNMTQAQFENAVMSIVKSKGKGKTEPPTLEAKMGPKEEKAIEDQQVANQRGQAKALVNAGNVGKLATSNGSVPRKASKIGDHGRKEMASMR